MVLLPSPGKGRNKIPFASPAVVKSVCDSQHALPIATSTDNLLCAEADDKPHMTLIYQALEDRDKRSTLKRSSSSLARLILSSSSSLPFSSASSCCCCRSSPSSSSYSSCLSLCSNTNQMQQRMSLPRFTPPLAFSSIRSQRKPVNLSLDACAESRLRFSSPFGAPYPSPPMSDSPPPKQQPEQPSGQGQSARQSPSRTILDVGAGLEGIQPSFIVAAPRDVQTSSQAQEDVQPPTQEIAVFPSLSEQFSPIAAPVRGDLPALETSSAIRPIAQPTILPSSLPSIVPPKTPRKPKGHVASACVNCKRKHLRCEERRPCSRCLQAGKEDTCVDGQHKKRGRPRLREAGSLRRPPAIPPVRSEPRPPSFEQAPTTTGGVLQSPFLPTYPARRPGPLFREIRSQREMVPYSPVGSERGPGTRASLPASVNMSPYQGSSAAQLPPHPSPHQERFGTAKALLNTNLTIATATQQFLDRIGCDASILGQELFNIVPVADHPKLMQLQAWIQNQRSSLGLAFPFAAEDRSIADVDRIRNMRITDVEQGPIRGQEAFDSWNIGRMPGPVRVTVLLVNMQSIPVVLLTLAPEPLMTPATITYQPTVFPPPSGAALGQFKSAPTPQAQYARPSVFQPSSPIYMTQTPFSPASMTSPMTSGLMERVPRTLQPFPSYPSPVSRQFGAAPPSAYSSQAIAAAPSRSVPEVPSTQMVQVQSQSGFSPSLQLPPIRPLTEGIPTTRRMGIESTGRRAREEDSEDEQGSRSRKKRVRICIGEIS